MIIWQEGPGTMWAGLPRVGFYRDGRLMGYAARRDVDRWAPTMYYETPSGRRFHAAEDAAAYLAAAHDAEVLRVKTDRVRNDGNWIYGNPADSAPDPEGRPASMIAHHVVGAPPLPDLEGWDTPQYGFSLNLAADARETVMTLRYTATPPPPKPVPALQLALF